MKQLVLTIGLIHVTLSSGEPYDLFVAMMVGFGKPITGHYAPECKTLIYTLGPTFCVREAPSEIRERVNGQ